MKAATWSQGNPLSLRSSHAEVRGYWLSHLIGLCFVIPFVFERAIQGEIYFTRFVDIPIRLLAVWLILDRVGRRGRVHVSTWDYIHMGFGGLYGMALIYADLYMQRDSGLNNYLSWVSTNFSPYFYFLIAREGTLRRGFRPYVVVQWMLGTLLFACVVAMVQALNIGNLRHVIDDFIRQRQAESKMEGPSQPWQARGLFLHANNMAIMLIMGLSLLFSAGYYRKFGIFEYICGIAFVGTLFATYSRTGIASAVVLLLGVIGLLFVQKKYKVAFVSLFALIALMFTFVTAVFVFDIKRYQVFVRGEGVVRKESERGMYGWYQRKEALAKAIALGSKYPFTGVKIATSALNEQNIIQRSSYTFEGLLLNVYGYAFVSYGIMGLLYLFGALYALIVPHLKLIKSRYAFTNGAILCGLAIMITGISENTLFTLGHMTVVNIIMAFAVQRIRRPEEKKAENALLPHQEAEPVPA